uniref:SAYSvFN domain-containing protein n=1 Tax=Anopheles farauti TaxID=69004 RepID=A0A182QTL5_9DIPT
MDSKLDNYRKTKRRKALLNDFKDRIYNMVSFHQVQTEEKASHVIIVADSESNSAENDSRESKTSIKVNNKVIRPLRSLTPLPSDTDDLDSEVANQEEQPVEKPRSLLTYMTYLVYFLFWATLYAIAIELRFGAVFLMLSALFGIYFNTRTKKSPGEISAYSVFNENCEAIDGTLKAEQFEREIGIRQ